MGERGLAKSSYNLQLILLYFWYLWGRELVENVIWGEERGWLKPSEYSHIGGRNFFKIPSYDI